MIKLTRAAACAPLIVLLASRAWGISFVESTGPDSVAPKVVPMGAGLEFAAGPCIQNTTSTGITIRWSTRIASVATVTISQGKSKWKYKAANSRRLHEVRVRGLKPDTFYSYRVDVTSPSGVVSGATSWPDCDFTTFPAIPRPIKFIVYGDENSKVIEAVAREKDLDFVIYTGELVTDDAKLARLMRKVPFFTNSERWYSFDVLNLHVAALDSNTSLEPGSKQYRWLVADLEKRRDARYKIIFMHHPVYTSGPHGNVDSAGQPTEVHIRTAQKIIPDLVNKYHISGVFSGYGHDYERSVRDGVPYIVTGGGGAANVGAANANNNRYRRIWVAGLSYCIVTVDNHSAKVTVKNPSGKVIDQFDL